MHSFLSKQGDWLLINAKNLFDIYGTAQIRVNILPI